MKLMFVIEGNHENKKGNPIPYLRMTQNEIKLLKIPDEKLMDSGIKKKWGIRRYLNWKKYVEVYLYFYSRIGGRKARKEEIERIINQDKVKLDCMIYFANKKHGDPDNIRKGIQDSIFGNDKHVVGCVDYDYDSVKPRVEVSIKKRR